MRFAAVVPLALAVAALAHPASARTWDQTWKVPSRPKVRIVTDDARVSLHHGAPGVASAHVEYVVTVWGFHSTVRDPEVILRQAGDSIVVTAKSHSTLVVFFGGVTERFHVDVTLPPEADVSVRTGDGAIESEPITGNLDFTAGDGHITVHGAHGNASLATGDGAIDADDADGVLLAHTGDGHVHASGRFDRLDIHTGDGRVEADARRGSQLTDDWSVTTGDGRVVLLIPRNLSAMLDVVSHDGPLHVELPIEKGDQPRHTLRGQLNGGTHVLRVRTGDGSIRLGLSE